MFERITRYFKRRAKIRNELWNCWGWCEAKDNWWKKLSRDEKAEVKRAASDIVDMREYLDDVYDFVRMVGESSTRNSAKITNIKLKLKSAINFANELKLKELL